MFLLGAGIFSRYIGVSFERARVRPKLHLGLAVGGALVVCASLGSVLLVLTEVVGRLDLSRLGEYLMYTGHGRWTLLRLVLVGGLVALGLGRALPLPLERTLHLALSAALLVSVSALSHAGASGNRLLLLADLGHLSAAALWAGSLIALALLPVWTKGHAALKETFGRVSKVGLFSVGLLFATGLYASSVHITSSAELTQTDYGFALLCKGLLVALIVGIAAGNRWFLLPRFSRGGVAILKRTVRLEALLLVGVLALSGVLTSRQPEALEPLEHTHAGLGLEITQDLATYAERSGQTLPPQRD